MAGRDGRGDKTERNARLAAALRANLRRRKAHPAAPGDAVPDADTAAPDPEASVA